MAYEFTLHRESVKRKFAVYVVIAKAAQDTKVYVGKTGDNNDGCNPMISRCGSYGVGQENEIATQAGIPAVRLIPQRGVSRMMLGSFVRAINVRYEGTLERCAFALGLQCL